MDADEVVTFLEALPARTGKLATVRADGRPHVAPVWFALDRSTRGPGSPIWRSGVQHGRHHGEGSQHPARPPDSPLCIDDDRPPFTFVTVEGVRRDRRGPRRLRPWAP